MQSSNEYKVHMICNTIRNCSVPFVLNVKKLLGGKLHITLPQLLLGLTLSFCLKQTLDGKQRMWKKSAKKYCCGVEYV